MLELTLAGIRGRASRTCPACGRPARIHGYLTRAVHDWQQTTAECLRLRCCGATFTTAPDGVTPRSRFTDRVVTLVRALVAAGASMRSCARTLTAAGVPLTLQTVRTWCRGIEPVTRASLRLTGTPDGAAFLRLRPELLLCIFGAKPRLIADILRKQTDATMAPCLIASSGGSAPAATAKSGRRTTTASDAASPSSS